MESTREELGEGPSGKTGRQKDGLSGGDPQERLLSGAGSGVQGPGGSEEVWLSAGTGL